jgi:phenylacetate-CoA ligase
MAHVMAGVIRPLAYNVISRRDGFAGWQRHRRAFRSLMQASPEEVQRQAEVSLSRLLKHAYQTVPFYREAWRSIGFKPCGHVTIEDLRQLPLVTKDDIRTRKGDLVSRAYSDADLQRDYTGGTSGTQTSFYRDRACAPARFGRQWGILEWCGYQPGDKRALVWGAHSDLPQPGVGSALKRWFRSYASADEVLCCTVMSRAEMLDYHRRLQAFRPSVLYGYPNAMEQFARFVVREGLARIPAARIFCTAEKLDEGQRLLLQEAFGGEVFDLYCSREHGCVAFECRRHRGFHVDTGNAIVEILRDGRPAEPGESGELVITDLLNYGMPLIRHATADMATAATVPCECGSPFPFFSSLDGRTTDLLYRPDGSIVAGIMLMDLFMDQPAIAEVQYVQEDPASLDVNVVRGRGAIADVHAIVESVRSIMGDGIAIRVRFVDEIPRNPRSGKYQEVICRIKAPAGAQGAVA